MITSLKCSFTENVVKHSTSWGRKILPSSKVKSLLAKYGKRYQAFHLQWVPLSSFKKTTTHHFTCSIRYCDFNIINGHNSYWLPQSRKSSWWIWIHSHYNRSVQKICADIRYYKQVYKYCHWKTFQRFCVEIRNFKSNATRAREGNLK